MVPIEAEWTARDREFKMFGGPARTFLRPFSVRKDGREPDGIRTKASATRYALVCEDQAPSQEKPSWLL